MLIHFTGLAYLAVFARTNSDINEYLQHALAGPIGMGMVFVTGLILHLIGAPLTVAPVVGLMLLLFFISACFARTAVLFYRPTFSQLTHAFEGVSWLSWTLLAAIILQVAYILFSALWRPVAMADDWGQWAANAKLLYSMGAIGPEFFEMANLSYNPQFIVLNELLLSRVHGSWSDFLCKAFLSLYLFYFTAFISLIAFKWSKSTVLALFAGLFTLTIPEFVRVGLNGTAEIPMCLAIGFAVGLIHVTERPSTSTYFLAGVFLGLVTGTKYEGIFAAVAIILSWSLFKFRNGSFSLKALFSLILPSCLVFIFWNITVHSFFENSHSDLQGGRFFNPNYLWLFDPSSYINIVGDVLGMFVAIKGFFLLSPYFIVSIVAFCIWHRDDRASRMFLTVMLFIAVVYAAGLYTVNVPVALPRLLSHVIGIALLFVIRQSSLAVSRSYQSAQ